MYKTIALIVTSYKILQIATDSFLYEINLNRKTRSRFPVIWIITSILNLVAYELDIVTSNPLDLFQISTVAS